MTLYCVGSNGHHTFGFGQENWPQTRESSSQAQEVTPLRSKRRSITSTAVYTALALIRFSAPKH